MLANGVLYHGTSGGVLGARDPATGAQLWSDSSTPGRSANAYLSAAVTAHHP